MYAVLEPLVLNFMGIERRKSMSAICTLSQARYAKGFLITKKSIEVMIMSFITQSFFKGRLISVCDDNSLNLWEIVAENAPTLKCVQSQSLEGK